MCGITGIINFSESISRLEVYGKRMLNTLQHRGPDSEGIWVSQDDGLLMGHRRLAIQDLSEHGAQPMFSCSGRYCVVFNGEIYNYRELARELEKFGYVFRGHSDSEVLLEAINEWGLTTAIQRFIGMFAFALWDVKEKVLHLCRDRVGEKPLYYGIAGNSFYFASELKAIECVTSKNDLKIDKVALNGFLKYGYINAPLSIYKDIFKLLPGTILSIRKNDIVNNKIIDPIPFWNIFDIATQSRHDPFDSESESVDKLDSLLKNTIRRQMISDVSVGTFLSGGIDSTLVTAIAQSEANYNIKTFTIGFHEKEYDESCYAKKIANYIGSDHQTVYVSPKDTLNVIPYLSAIYDEPFADSSQIPTYLVSKIAKEQVTVCLSGDGGDELFAGYNRYMWLSLIWDRVNVMPFGIRIIIGKLLSIPSPRLWEQIFSIILTTGSKKKYKLLGLKLQKLSGLLQQKNIRNSYDYLLSYWHNANEILLPDYQSEYSCIPPKFPSAMSFIEEAMYCDQISYLPGDNLVKVDRASMRVSLETRLPLLSHEVVEFSWRLPLHLKVKNNNGKWVLRKVLERYIPTHLVDRPKMGFSVPVSKWLQTDLKEWAEDLLFNNSRYANEIFKMDLIKKKWEQHLTGTQDHSARLWTVLTFLSWYNDRQ